MIHLSFIGPLTNSKWPTKSELQSNEHGICFKLFMLCVTRTSESWQTCLCVQKNLIRLWSRLGRRQIVFSCWGLWNHNRIMKLLECFEDNQCINSSFWSIILAKPGVWPFQPKPSWVWWFKTRTRLESTGTSPGIKTLDFGPFLWTEDDSG